MNDTTALIRKAKDFDDDLEDPGVTFVYMVNYSGSNLFDLFKTERAAQLHMWKFKGSSYIKRRVM